MHHGRPILGAGSDVEEYQFIGALAIVSPRDLDRIAGIGDVLEAHALDDAALVHVQAGNDALRQGLHRCLHVTRRSGTFVDVTLGFDEIEPTLVKGTPQHGASDTVALHPHSALISSMPAIPPEAMIGIRTERARFTVASTLTPLSMPSRLMSV